MLKKIGTMEKRIDEELSDKTLTPAPKKLVQSSKNRWDALTVFVDEPSIPMDNHYAE